MLKSICYCKQWTKSNLSLSSEYVATKLCKPCTSFTSHLHSWCGMVWYRTSRVNVSMATFWVVMTRAVNRFKNPNRLFTGFLTSNRFFLNRCFFRFSHHQKVFEVCKNIGVLCDACSYTCVCVQAHRRSGCSKLIASQK